MFCSERASRRLGCLVLNVFLTRTVFLSAEVKEVFDLFDFWDGRDGMVDAAKIGDFLRCCNLNPTNAIVLANGGVEKMGSSRIRFLLDLHPSFFYHLPFFSLLCCVFTFQLSWSATHF